MEPNFTTTRFSMGFRAAARALGLGTADRSNDRLNVSPNPAAAFSKGNPMIIHRLLPIAALLLAAPSAHAVTCQLDVEANDMMQFSTRKLEVDASCEKVRLTLKHTGSSPAAVMGHNWVLVRNTDVVAIANAALRAGRDNHYQPPADARVLAMTPTVGGGESATITFDTAALHSGETYSFFCSTPGHGAVMRGTFVVNGGPSQLAADARR